MSYAELVAEATARPNGPSKKQIDWLLKLAGERVDVNLGSNGEERVENIAAWLESATKQETSRAISWLLKQPVDTRVVQVPAQRAAVTTSQAPREVDPDVTPGVYEVDGRIYVVKPNKTKTRLYAMRLVETQSERFTESGDLLKIGFKYEAGAIFDVKPAHRMELERAQALTIRYGHCIVCGRELRAGKSVKQGMGPVCVKLFS
jgi:hypothetical protein